MLPRLVTFVLIVGLVPAAALQGAEETPVLVSVAPSEDCFRTLDGAFLYQELCVSCHGASGRGSGPASVALTVQPADLTLLASANGGSFPSTRVLHRITGKYHEGAGGSEMPEWGWILGGANGDEVGARLRIHQLVQHVRTLQRTFPSSTPAPPFAQPPAAAPASEVVRIDPWMLLQSSGEELFQQMCASCHGDQGVGGRVSATSPTMSPPPLTHLEAAGIDRDHWTYVIESSCDDAHHRNPDGSQGMPCWRQAFRQTLGNDAATVLVSTKLADYIGTIQEGHR